MPSVQNVVRTLQTYEKSLQNELGKVRAAVQALGGSTVISRGTRQTRRSISTKGQSQARGRMSRAARKAVSLRMKKYWAERRKAAK